MYALKKITVTEDGRHVEEVHVLGDMYRLEFYPRNTHLAAKIEYCRDGNIPCIPVEKEDEAYIITLNGDTARCICRGDSEARNEIARCRAHTDKEKAKTPAAGTVRGFLFLTLSKQGRTWRSINEFCLG